MKIDNATIVRAPGKNIPDDLISKASGANNSSVSFAVCASDGNSIVARKHIGSMSLDEAKQFIGHPSLASRQVIIQFSNNPGVSTPEDAQPFTIMEAEDPKDKKIKPIVVAFLNGDFSQYAQEGSTKSPEALCVEKAIVPHINKVFKIADQDLHKMMIELKDEVWAGAFANMMIGPEGSITILASNGDNHTFLVQGETLSHAGDGYWTSNTFGEQKEPAVEQDDLEKELGDAPAIPTKAPDKPRVIPQSKTQTNTAPPPQVAKPKPGHGLEGSKPPVAAPKVAPADQPAVRPAPSPAPGPAAKPGTVLPDLTNAESVLKIKIPTSMDGKKKWSWCKHRCPEELLPTLDVRGLTHMSCKLGQANKAFLQTYVEQNKLAGLSVFAKFLAIGDYSPETDTAIPQTVAAVPATGKARIIPSKKEQGYPERAEETQPAVVEPPAKKDTDPHIVGKPSPAVVTEPLPVFSPTQKEEILTFLDKKGIKVPDPKEIEKMEKMAEPFSKQFGGKITLANLAGLKLEDIEEYAKHDLPAICRIVFWQSVELMNMSRMLDELTDPLTRKTGADVATEVKTAYDEAARVARPGRIIPAKRTA